MFETNIAWLLESCSMEYMYVTIVQTQLSLDMAINAGSPLSFLVPTYTRIMQKQYDLSSSKRQGMAMLLLGS